MPDRKIKLVPELYRQDLARLTESLKKAPPDLLLIGRRQLRSNNSWMHNSRRLVKGKNRCTLLMHPEDARKRGLETGMEAIVSSRAGEIRIPVEVSEEVMPGVASIPHGWGHDREGTQLEVANAHPGASLNDVTDERMVDALTGNAVLNGLPVEVRPGVE
jgi:anaerobic selenocysteine-containing dehydrogenase